MASIRKEFTVAADAKRVWDAFRDVGKVHTRLAPGFVTDCRLDGDERVVTFANGFVARELIVDVDDDARRLAYAAHSERLEYHNASFQVFDDGPGHCRVVWIADVLPAAAAASVNAMMDAGVAAMSKTLGAHSQPA
jgi:carbon monoxide dehydrogenase subunit G